MKRKVLFATGSFLLLIVLLFGLTSACQFKNKTEGEELYSQALDLEKQKSYSHAARLYKQALPLLVKEKNLELASRCSEASQRLTLFEIVYPYSSEQIAAHLKEAYPQATAEKINSWIAGGEMERCSWDGQEHYFQDVASNLKFKHLDLMQEDTAKEQEYRDLALRIIQIAQEKPAAAWQQYQKPAVYRGTHTISIPRKDLPETGTYRIWLPLPINNGPQTQVTIESIIPDKWVKQPPSIDQDIGLLYMEVPVQELTGDLFIQVKFTFTHYEQRFSVDPDNMGEYDKDSALYQEYTRSYGNTEITADIRKLARKIVGDETNPYKAARKIYDYIVHNVTYALMPHLVLWPRTQQTESDYVHKYQRGDCGAQSMYFSAMCRSLGIPARTTGGWQLFNGEFNGHFWAEFYLPNYGWVPVDTSVAQLALYPKDLTAQQRQAFIDFYFGNQDSMRCVVQKDTDEPLIPRADGLVLLPLAIQLPVVEYSIPTGEIPAMVFLDNWTMQCEKTSP